ncbi:hypothetical protein [Bradyrhizobium pachyrhizi]|uniref:hypothetical protein n=1 Tax=Bradyrhizobium pachyrhizi TaxID=280333 RepID=UPI003D362AF0
MLDLREHRHCVWDQALCPIGEGENKESFAKWWARHEGRLAHLHPQIAEQWIYRHWAHSYMAFLPLEGLTWRHEIWEGDEILKRVHMEFGGPMNAEHDFRVFNGRPPFGPPATALALNQGTWDIPLLVLETPAGIRSMERDLPDTRYVVAEGSKRMRYLYALRQHDKAPGPHELFILKSPNVV